MLAAPEAPVLEELERRGLPVEYMQNSVATSAYTPRLDGRRPISVINYGRRDPSQHVALKSWSRDSGAWYHYDTMSMGATADVLDHHRALGRMLSESSVSMCNLARFSDHDRIQGLQEVGSRYYEALAGGCVICGDFPDSPVFDTSFARLPGLVPWKIGTDDGLDELLAVLADPDRLARIARVHRAEALAHHDVAHRVLQVCERAGFTPPAKLLARVADLKDKAAQLLA